MRVLCDGIQNRLSHAVGIASNLIIAEPKHPIAGDPQPTVTEHVRLDGEIARFAVDLNDQLMFETDEIREVLANWSLASKFEATKPAVPKLSP